MSAAVDTNTDAAFYQMFCSKNTKKKKNPGTCKQAVSCASRTTNALLNCSFLDFTIRTLDFESEDSKEKQEEASKSETSYHKIEL